MMASQKRNVSTLLGIMIMAVMTFVMVGCRAFPDGCHGRDNAFSIVVMPDTQNYTDSSFGGSPQ